MSLLFDEKTKVVIQGITGREGQARALLMKEYGTNVVAGVTPGRAGQNVHGVPVFDTVQEAVDQVGPLEASVIFIPAALCKAAAFEAIDAGVKLLVIVPDRVPLYDVLEIAAHAQAKGARFVGPNTLGMITPGRAVLGMIGGRAASARDWFKVGPVGVASRSGGMTTAVSYYLGRAGVGLSRVIHVGGDSVVGSPHPDVMLALEADPGTKAVVMLGEIGTTQEERVAELRETGRFTKPLVAWIGGAAAKSGTRFSHAGAIVEGGRGSWDGKVARLQEAGARVVENFDDIPQVTSQLLAEMGIKGQVNP
ncbi:MAG: CoA-binding protein [Deltaproteobacteria bacterium]|nr:CoA-binding protein [Deltaproteobacteria bacterium]